MPSKAPSEQEEAGPLPAKRRRALVVSELSRLSNIRVLFHSFPVRDLREIIERLKTVLRERVEEETRKQEAIANKALVAQNLIEIMEKEGLTLEDLKKQKQDSDAHDVNKRPPKYFKDGKSWSGWGRRPSVFVGMTKEELEECRITHENPMPK